MKILAALLAILLLSGCGTTSEYLGMDSEPVETAGYIKISGTGKEPELRLGCEEIRGSFCSLWAEKDGDELVAGLTELRLLTVDRRGEVLMNSACGETREYGGEEYEYTGAANLEIERTEDGGAVYIWRLREDLYFSDGRPVTADDLIFSLAVAFDSDFDGCGSEVPEITGLRQYMAGVDGEIYEKYRAMAEGYLSQPSARPDDMERWFYEEAMGRAWENECRHIVEYCGELAEKHSSELGFSAEEIRGSSALSCAFAMYMWGFGEIGGGSLKGLGTGESRALEEVDMDMFVAEARTLYEDPEEFFRLEGTGTERESITECAVRIFISHWGGGEQKTRVNIRGIEKTDGHTVSVRTDTYKASDIFAMDIPILPLHYYGNTESFDPEKGLYGFEKGNLRAIREKTDLPPGAGPYALVGFDGTEAVLRANKYYKLSTPATSTVKVIAAGAEPAGIRLDEYDMCFTAYEDSYTDGTAYEAAGYGYIGINAQNVKVGDNPFSEQSQSLRTALGAVIAACRSRAADYYGLSARATAVRIGEDCWAYSEGGLNYEEGDALAAAIGYLRGAGYVWDPRQCRFTDAPRGASLSYTIMIPADGCGEHPACRTAERAAEILEKIGVELKIIDFENSNDLISALREGDAELWAAAWTGTPDPDIYQIFSSENIPGSGTGLNYFRLRDDELDGLLQAARETAVYEERKALYARAQVLIDREAVEIPLYRRLDGVYYGRRIDESSIEPATAYYSPMRLIENIRMK